MTTMPKAMTVAAAVAAALAAISVGVWYYLFVSPDTWVKSIGGKWEIEYRDTAMHQGGPAATLYRQSADGRRRVDDLVYVAQYYGADCIAYETTRDASGPLYFAACGDRQPILIGKRERTWYGPTDVRRVEWTIGSTGIECIETRGAMERRRTVEVAELVRKAMAQPVVR